MVLALLSEGALVAREHGDRLRVAAEVLELFFRSADRHHCLQFAVQATSGYFSFGILGGNKLFYIQSGPVCVYKECFFI